MNQKLVEDTKSRETLRRGAFYWARVSTKIPTAIVTEWQPVRYTGRTADGVGDTWDFIGLRSEDGHHFADVIEVGQRVIGAPDFGSWPQPICARCGGST